MLIFDKEEYIENQLNQILSNVQLEYLIKSATEKLIRTGQQFVCAVFDDLVIDISTCDHNTFRELRYGYPFPLFIKQTKNLHLNCKVIVSLAGSKIRKKQHEGLIEKLVSQYEIQCNTISSEDFKIIAENGLKEKWDEYLYIDPYRFVGDSFIGLVCADALARKNEVQVNNLTHNEALRHAPFLAADPIEYVKNCISSKCIVMPNFIDDQWDETFFIINSALSAPHDILMLIPGRNLIIWKKKGGIVELFKLTGEEFILWKKNKEEMLFDAMNVFNLEIEYKYSAQRKTNHTIVNPLTSKKNKNLKPELALRICDILDAKLIVSYDHAVEINTAKNQVLNPKNISELICAIENSDFVCTADTAVAHIANRLNKFCIVIYNNQNWDCDSIISSIHNSSLGFSSRKQNFLPLICNFEKCNHERIITLISEIRNIINFSWDEKILELISNITNEFEIGADSSERFDTLHSLLITQMSLQFPSITYLYEFYYDFYRNSSICLNNFSYRKLIEKLGPLYKLGFIVTK
jgi:hypothetical protein